MISLITDRSTQQRSNASQQSQRASRDKGTAAVPSGPTTHARSRAVCSTGQRNAELAGWEHRHRQIWPWDQISHYCTFLHVFLWFSFQMYFSSSFCLQLCFVPFQGEWFPTLLLLLPLLVSIQDDAVKMRYAKITDDQTLNCWMKRKKQCWQMQQLKNTLEFFELNATFLAIWEVSGFHVDRCLFPMEIISEE